MNRCRIDRTAALKNMQCRRVRCRGFTLIELMVAMTVGLFLIGGILSLFIGSKQTHKSSEAVAEIQEKGRFLLTQVALELRQSGNLGCQRTLLLQKKPPAGTAEPLMDTSFWIKNTLNFTNVLTGPPTPPSAETYNWLFNFNERAPVEGFDGQGSEFVTSDPPPGISTDDLFDELNLDEAVGNSDVIVSRRASGNPVPIKKHDELDDPLVLFNVPALNFSKRDIAIASTCNHATVFQITDIKPDLINDGTTIEIKELDSSDPDFKELGNKCNTNPKTDPCDLGFTYANPGTTLTSEAIGHLYHASTTIYYIRNDENDDDRPALYIKYNLSDSQSLVNGVYSMQLLYGSNSKADDCSGTDDSEIENYQSADKVENWNKVNAVRVALLLGSTEDNIVDQPMKLSFPAVSAEGSTQEHTFHATDRRFYQVFSSTIFLRNKLPCLNPDQWTTP